MDMVMVRDTLTGEVREMPAAEAAADDRRYRYLVLDVRTREVIEVHRLEAAAGLYEFGESLGQGTAGCAVVCERALDLAGDSLRWRRQRPGQRTQRTAVT
jgi:hypothetical protein